MPRTPRTTTRHRPVDPAVGLEVELEVGPVAHGGHCVARHEGRVVFVRHTLPGERVRAVITEGGTSFWRADAVEVLDASPDRVEPAWPAAGPGGVGGGEFSHVALPAQRRWKAGVIAEQLHRLAAIDRDVTVEAAPGDDERGGLGYRTRIDLVAGPDGRLGMRKHRSHDVVPVKPLPKGMPLATDEVAALAAAEGVLDRSWEPGTRVELVAPVGGEALVLVDGQPWHKGHTDTRPNARRSVTETVGERTFRVAADGFWQVHRAAPAVLTEAVLQAAGDLTEATVLDLYSGAGLFTVPLAEAVGEHGRVIAVEGDARAVKDARRNAHDLPWVELHESPVEAALTDLVPGVADVVVLDPPRTGAGRAVVDAIAERSPSRIVYVACDPAALARDVAYLAGHGYTLTGLRAFDLFPHTHHVEAVGAFRRA